VSNFQQTVNWDLNLGVPGDLILDEPYRITPVTLAAAGYLGQFFTIANGTGLASPGVALAAGSVIFGGIAVLSKDEPLFGSSAASPLNANLQVEANAQVALMSMGSCVVSIPNAWNEGDYLQYNTTTGALATYSPSGSPSGGFAQVPNAIMVRSGNAASGGGLGIARLTN
jgi:hypothetical protein